MRMWMAPFDVMCSKHLRGEHVETHMFVGCIKKGNSVAGFVRDGLFDPSQLYARHDAIGEEMMRRGGAHRSPIERLPDAVWQALLKSLTTAPCIDVEANVLELSRRCPDCYDMHLQARGELPFRRGGDKILDRGSHFTIQFTGAVYGDRRFEKKDAALRELERMRRAMTLHRQGRLT